MLNFAIQTAREAGRLLTERMGRLVQITNKGEIDLVTEGDLAAEKLIIERIRSHYPRHSILAEESGEAVVAGSPPASGSGSSTHWTGRQTTRTVIRASAFQSALSEPALWR